VATTSGTYTWGLDNSQIIVEAFSRLGVHPTSLTREHFISAGRSLNLALQSFSNKGVNLWQVELISIPLIQGVATYNLPSNLVNILDAYIETYSLQTTISQVPNFSTVSTSNTVTLGIINHGLVANNWINVVIPVSIGGIIIQGLYQVTTVLNANTFTITVTSAATATVNNAGALPVFTATNNSASISVSLANHGLLPGNTFTVQETTMVDGQILEGPYIISTVVDANTFTFVVTNASSSNDTEPENSGNSVILTQLNSQQPFDRILTSISRTDYASQPDKLLQGPPTTFWFDRLSPIPTLTTWYVADGNGPYVIFAYCMRRIMDASYTGGQLPDLPYRFLDAVCADMALRLARKYAPALVQMLAAEAQEAWNLASVEDRERVEMFICPNLSGYFQ
jgi:hypothetical protein